MRAYGEKREACGFKPKRKPHQAEIQSKVDKVHLGKGAALLQLVQGAPLL